MADTDVNASHDRALVEENAALRARVSELEQQLGEQARRTNEIVAGAQDRAYWLDRYHVDLNAIMALPGMGALRALLRAIRVPLRMARQLKRRVLR
jgi:hypothetical protein